MAIRENYPQIKYTTKAQNAPHEIPMNAKVLRGDHFSEERVATVSWLRLLSRSKKISGIAPRFALQRLRAFGFTGAPTLREYWEKPLTNSLAKKIPLYCPACCEREAGGSLLAAAQPTVI